MAFFKKGIAFNKLAKSLNSTYIMLNELEIKLKQIMKIVSKIFIF
jgi:hypothetical protein